MSTSIHNMSGSIMSFPHQKRSRTQKTKKFYKECVDAGDLFVGLDMENGFRSTLREKISNYNLVNNIVDPEEVKRVINPYNLEAEFTAEYKNYPLINSYLMVLLGEERESPFHPMVTMTNPDLINQKLQDMTGMMNETIIQQVVSADFSEEEAQKRIQEQSKYLKFNYRDRRERMASQILRYGYLQNDMKEMFSRTFEDLLIGSEQLASAEILGGEPILRKINPLNLFTIRSSDTYKVEESDMIVELSYIPVGQVIDEHHDDLSDSEIKKLEEGYEFNSSASSLFTRQLKNQPINLESWIIQQGGIGNIIEANASQSSYLGGSFDEFGNVRKLRILWKGMRKLGILSYLDEQGDLQKDYIDEDYPLSDEEKEWVKWIWVSEWYEGTKLADDIYVKMGPRPVQFRSMDNPSSCSPGIVGNIMNVNSSQALSFVGLNKDYQLTYNYFMHKLWEELKTYKGKVARVNTSLIPSSFTLDQFLFYVDQMKIAFEDPFNEGNEGAAMGKLAGNLNQSSGSYEFGDSQVINNILGILTFLENRIQDSTGITPQRKGEIQSRETVGGVERSVEQSSMNTSKYFDVHDNFKVRALEIYLETAKVAWKGQNFQRQFVMDDGSQQVLDFDSDVFTESSYGIFTNGTNQDKSMMQTLKSLTQPFLQSGGTFSMVMELYRTQDMASLQRKFEAFEEQVRQQQEEAGKMAEETRRMQMQKEDQLEQAKLEIEKYKADLDSQTKIQVAQMKQNEEPEEEENDDLEEEKLEETIRKNKKQEELKQQEINIKKKQSSKKT